MLLIPMQKLSVPIFCGHQQNVTFLMQILMSTAMLRKNKMRK